jgi:hypothetical protein
MNRGIAEPARLVSFIAVFTLGGNLVGASPRMQIPPNTKPARPPCTQGLLRDAPPSPTESSPSEPGVVRARYVEIDFSLLAEIKGPPPHTTVEGKAEITLNLFPDTCFQAALDRLEARSGESFSWIGHVLGENEGQVTLVREKDALSASIMVARQAYELRRAPDGRHYVAEIQLGELPPEAPPVRPAPLPAAPPQEAEGPPLLFRSTSGGQPREAEASLLRLRYVIVDLGPLLMATGPPGSGETAKELRLNLFDDTEFTAVLDEIRVVAPNRFAWIGRLRDRPGSRVNLEIHGETLTGAIRLGDAFYEIRPQEGGIHVVRQLKPGTFPPG